MLTINHEEEQVRAFDGDLGSRMRFLRKVWIRACADTPGVDNFKGRDTEAANRNDPIAGDAGLIMNDCNLAAREAIEQSVRHGKGTIPN